MAAFNPANFTAPKAKPLPVVLLLDTSTSMSGERIQALNQATQTMIDDFANAERSEIEILISIITFGNNGVQHYQPFASASDIQWQDLQTGGNTPMGTAFSMVKALIEDKEQTPSRAYRPTLVLVSDGEPNDPWETPLKQLVEEGRSSKCDRMAMAIGTDTNNTVLNRFIEGVEHSVFEAKDATEIKKFFQFVTMSVTTRTHSQNPNLIPKDNQISDYSFNETEKDSGNSIF